MKKKNQGCTRGYSHKEPEVIGKQTLPHLTSPYKGEGTDGYSFSFSPPL